MLYNTVLQICLPAGLEVLRFYLRKDPILERICRRGGFGPVMSSRIDRYWRVFGTGLSFAAVGIGGVWYFPYST